MATQISWDIGVFDKAYNPVVGVTVAEMDTDKTTILNSGTTGSTGFATITPTNQNFIPRVMVSENFKQGLKVIMIPTNGQGGGAGPYYDYIVDSNWTGTEGQSFTNLTGWTFKVYSTITGAINHIETLNINGTLYRVGIVAGTYAETVTITGNQGSGVALIGLGTVEERGDFGQVYISSAMVLNIVGTTTLILENLTISGITYTTGKISGHASKCEFVANAVDFSAVGFWFRDCEFVTASKVDCDGDVDDVAFFDCTFNNADLDFLLGQVDGLQISGCDFLAGSDILFDDVSNLTIADNVFSVASGTHNNFIFIVATSICNGINIEGNVFENGPATNGQTINLDARGAEIWGVQIGINTYSSNNSGTGLTDTCHVRLTGDSLDKIFGITVANNGFGADSAQLNTLEDAGGFSVIADYLEQSVLGPNTPVGIAKYKVTNGANNLIIPSSADNEGAASSGAIAIGSAETLATHTHASSAQGGTVDHGVLTGQTDDDHIQYHKSAGDTGTGVHDFGGADSFEIPNSAAPTVDVDGEVALDTTVTDFSHGLIRYYGGEAMVVIAVPTAAIDTAPTDGYVLAYNATTDEFEFVANAGGGGGSGSMTTVKKDGVQVGDADIVVLDFGSGLSAIETPDTEINLKLGVLTEDWAVSGGDILLASGVGLVVGHTAQLVLVGTPEVQVLGTGEEDSSILLARWGANATAPRFKFVKSRGTSVSAATGGIVTDNDDVGQFLFYVDDGTDLETIVASYTITVDDASPAANDVGAEHRWQLLPGGGGALRNVLIIEADGDLNLVVGNPTGKFATPSRTIEFLAASLIPNTTNPAGAVTQTEASNGRNYESRAFAANEQASRSIVMPKNYDGGTITFHAHWLSPTGSSAGDTVIWGLAAVSAENGDAIDEALGTQVTVTDTVLTGVGRYHKADESAAITIGGTPGSDTFVTFELTRTGGTMTEEAELVAVYITYTTDAYEDQ